jgi:hypothetical protein
VLGFNHRDGLAVVSNASHYRRTCEVAQSSASGEALKTGSKQKRLVVFIHYLLEATWLYVRPVFLIKKEYLISLIGPFTQQ